jgi:hypothetical protein
MIATALPGLDGALGGMQLSARCLLRRPPSACKRSFDHSQEAKVWTETARVGHADAVRTALRRVDNSGGKGFEKLGSLPSENRQTGEGVERNGANRSGAKRTGIPAPISGPRYRGSNLCLPAIQLNLNQRLTGSTTTRRHRSRGHDARSAEGEPAKSSVTETCEGSYERRASRRASLRRA